MKKNLSADPASKTEASNTNYRSIAAVAIIGLLLSGIFVLSGFFQKDITSNENSITEDQLFDHTKIRNIHLEFKDSAYRQIQPLGGPFGINGVGKGWYNNCFFEGATFLFNGDTDKDREFTRQEFMIMAEQWFSQWDTKGDSALDFNMIDIGYGKLGMDLRAPVPGMRNGVGPLAGLITPMATADLRFEDINFESVTIRHKGNGTLWEAVKTNKRSFKIDVNDGFPSRNLAGITKFNLHNLVTDAGYMNDVLAYKLFRDAKVPAPRTTYTKLYITTPDTLKHHYMGLYLLVENVDNNFANNWYGTKKGVVFKPVTPRFFEDMGDDWSNYIQTYDPKTPVSLQESNRIIETCKFVTHADDEEFSKKLDRYFDLDNLARFIAVSAFICDLDGILGPGQNLYMYLHPKTQQLSFIPWDHDHSFGQMRGTQEEREKLSLDKPWMLNNFFLERLFKDQQFKSLYLDYMREFNETIFQPEHFLKQIKEIAKVIRPAVEEESLEKLRIFDFVVGLNKDGVPAKDSVNKEGAKPFRHFITPRHTSVREQLSGKSSGLEIKGIYFYGFYGGMFMSKMDNNKDSLVSYREFTNSFDKWFNKWADTKSGRLTYDGLCSILNYELSDQGPDPFKKEEPITSNDDK